MNQIETPLINITSGTIFVCASNWFIVGCPTRFWWAAILFSLGNNYSRALPQTPQYLKCSGISFVPQFLQSTDGAPHLCS